HRDYTVAYTLGENNKTIAYNSGQNGGSHEFIAIVLGVGKGYVEVEMRNRFRRGDVLEVLSPSKNFNANVFVGDMYDDKGNLIDDAKIVQQKVKIVCDLDLKAGDILRRKR
ncbi:MAG: U32 family peptidase C-terminal domain-containing protein, partial [Clostridia bacterium]|nr:U32 family peptidase C-terminal domain-containing protein [Clostridia bacterium]